MNKMIKVVAVIVTLVIVTGCSMGLKYDSKGDVEGYTRVSKVNLDESK